MLFRSVVKVTNVDDTGAILNAELLRFGSGYDLDFYSTVTSQTIISIPGFNYNTVTGQVTVSENLESITDSGFISKPTYVDASYTSGDYCNEIIGVFNYSGVGQGSGSGDYEAVFYIKVGAKGKYPGYYKSNKGFLSDDVIRMQDSDYYQPFSYVLISKTRLEDYKKAIYDILHPAGLNLIGEYLLLNEIDTAPTLQTTFDFLRITFLDTFQALDFPAKHTTRPITKASGLDDANVIPTDSTPIKTIGKAPTENVSFLSDWPDQATRHLTRYVNNPSYGYPGANDTTNLSFVDAAPYVYLMNLNYTNVSVTPDNLQPFDNNIIYEMNVIYADVETILDDVAKNLTVILSSNAVVIADVQTSNVQPAFISNNVSFVDEIGRPHV